MSFLHSNDVTLYYREAGRGNAPPVVLANSLGTDCRIWDAVIAPLAERYRIISYDKRGHGLSDAPAAPYTMAEHVADLAGLADGLGLDRFALAGVSVGGMIAQGLAAASPERLAALVLCDTAARIGPAQIWDARIAAIAAGGIASISGAILERWFSRAFREGRPIELAGWRNLLERTPVEGYVGTCAALRDADLRDGTGRIALRTLVVVGEEDGSTPPAVVGALAAALPNARFETIAGAGHLPMIEQPERLAALMQGYFTEMGYV
ncbi:3-oxoadipate enol-lactonase [Devosia sp.]|uniref:3-oxoadipate enol-lactonase n=1 Tax=Devosia sp. TaxID=1871048 RepID=UPI002EFB3C59